jgi:multidrug resistance efflux pump
MKVRFTPPPQAEVSRGMKVPYGPGRRNAAQWRWHLILVLVASPFVYLLFSLAWPYLTLTAPGVVVLDRENVVAAGAGTVHTLHLRPGDPVEVGQPLVTLVSAALDERIAAARAALAEAAPPPAAAGRTGAGAASLAPLEELLRLAEQAASRQAERLAVVQELLAEGAATVAEVESAAAEADSARRTLLQTRREVLAASREGAQAAPAAVSPDRQRLQERLEALEREQQGLVARAPLAGRLLDLPVEAGQQVAPGTVLAQVAVPGRAQVEAYLRPAALAKAAQGREVTVRLADGRSVQARVREQPSRVRQLPAGLAAAANSSRDPMLLVTLDLAEPLPVEQAIQGMPVEVRFPRF